MKKKTINFAIIYCIGICHFAGVGLCPKYVPMPGPMVDANHASAGCDGRTGSIQMGKVKGKRMKS